MNLELVEGETIELISYDEDGNPIVVLSIYSDKAGLTVISHDKKYVKFEQQ